jgi:hypothetical protein
MEAMGWLKISQEKSGVAIFRAILKQNYVIIYLSNTFKPFYHKFQTSFIQTLKKNKSFTIYTRKYYQTIRNRNRRYRIILKKIPIKSLD